MLAFDDPTTSPFGDLLQTAHRYKVSFVNVEDSGSVVLTFTYEYTNIKPVFCEKSSSTSAIKWTSVNNW